MIRVVLPHHLRTLAHTGKEVQLQIEGPATQRAILDALEAQYPMLRGTVRDRATQQRLESPDAPLPAAVAAGVEPFMIVGAMAGG